MGLHKSLKTNSMHGEGIEPHMDHFDRYPDLLGASVYFLRLVDRFVRELWPLELALWSVLL
jgi:hypothetical protein